LWVTRNLSGKPFGHFRAPLHELYEMFENGSLIIFFGEKIRHNKFS
jgi:hypothetical protein